MVDRQLPVLLKLMHTIEVDYADGDGIDFEPFGEFHSKSETAEWIKAWTGNNTLDGQEYLIFGQDGSGGYAAIWLARDTEDLLQQPIVFFGSEGSTGVVAQNFDAYVWLFANGVGPYEAVENHGFQASNCHEFLSFAQELSLPVQNSPVVPIENSPL